MNETIKIVIDGQRGDVVARASGIRRVDFDDTNPNLALSLVSSAIPFRLGFIRDLSIDELYINVEIDVIFFLLG